MFLAEEDTTADAFCFCVSLGGRGVLNVTAMKIKDAEAASGEVLKSGH